MLANSKAKTSLGKRREMATARQIYELQQNKRQNFLPKMQFMRMVRDLQQNYQPVDKKIKWSSEALTLFQQMVEEIMTLNISNSLLCTVHAKRVLLKPNDLMLIRRLKDEIFGNAATN